MKLYLVQHGNQLPENIDPNQGLSEKGITDCAKIASFISKTEFQIDKIFHSVKLRAKQTAEIFAKHLSPNLNPEEKEGLKPMDDVFVCAEQIKDTDENLMLVGHMPFMQKLSSLLLNGDENKKIVHFEQGSILCLEQNENKEWEIKFFVTPEIIK
jgi:phosphohistidine phosphatase